MTTVYSLLETGHLVLSRWKWDLCPYFAFRNRQAKYKPSGMKTNSFGLPIQGRSVHESLGLKFPKFPILKKKCSVKFQRWGNTNISNLVFWNRAMVFHIRLLLQLFQETKKRKRSHWRMREAWVVQGVKQLPSGQVLIPEGQDPAPPQTPCSMWVSAFPSAPHPVLLPSLTLSNSNK